MDPFDIAINTLICNEPNSYSYYIDHGKYILKLKEMKIRYYNISQFLDFNRQYLSKYLFNCNKQFSEENVLLNLEEYIEKIYRQKPLILCYHQHFPEYRKFINKLYDENLKSDSTNIHINFELEYIKQSKFFKDFYDQYIFMYNIYHNL